MFCVVYQWKVKPGHDEQFRGTWRTITEAIFQQHGSLGSRLHNSDDGTFVAYAQWPDREHWKLNFDTLGVDLARSSQVECLLEPIKVLMSLTVTDDLLSATPFQDHSQPAPLSDPISGPPKLRVARPTDKMEEIVRFYRDGLGLQELGRFENHEGFDGVMLGAPHVMYHLEFTHCRGHIAGTAPTQDNLLVFYMPDQKLFQDALQQMQDHGYEPVSSFQSILG